MKKELLVGIVFVVAIAVTAFGTIVVSGFTLFRPTQTWLVTMDDVGDLQTGDEVRILGHRMGVVKKIQFIKDTRPLFRVKLEMDKDTPVHAGYKITVRDTSALGGKYLLVEPGDLSKPAADVKALQGSAPPPGGVMGGLTDVLDQLQTTITSINEAKGTLGKLIMEDDVYRDLRSTTESLRVIAERIESGQGTLGHLVNDDQVYEQVRLLLEKLNNGDSAIAKLMRDESGEIVDNLRTLSASLASIAEKIDEGQGTAGLLVNDPKLYENAADTFSRTSELLQKASEGKSVVGVLLNDEKAGQAFSDTLDNLASLTDKLQNGNGTLPRLLTDGEIYESLQRSAQHIESATAKIDTGDGTLAKLINDPELYEKAKRLLSRAIDTVENARDSAPVTAITSFILGPFQ